jgi:hypothetical protein
VGASYSIDRPRRLVRSRAWGVLSNDDLRQHYYRIMADPAFKPDFRQLADLRDVEQFTIDVPEIRAAANVQVFDAGTRRAFVAPDDVGFGLSRMFSAYADMIGQNVCIFRDLAAAEEWLGV